MGAEETEPDPTLLQQVGEALLPILVVALVGAVVEWCVEGWHFYDCMFWAVTTVTTIGYGDHAPKFNGDRYFAIIFIPIGVSVTSYSLSKLGNIYLDWKGRQARDAVLNRELDTDYLMSLDKDGDSSVNLYEFAVFMLKALDRVDDQTVQMIEQRFRTLDKNHDGAVNRDDIMQLLQSPASNTPSPIKSPLPSKKTYGSDVDF